MGVITHPCPDLDGVLAKRSLKRFRYTAFEIRAWLNNLIPLKATSCNDLSMTWTQRNYVSKRAWYDFPGFFIYKSMPTGHIDERDRNCWQLDQSAMLCLPQCPGITLVVAQDLFSHFEYLWIWLILSHKPGLSPLTTLNDWQTSCCQGCARHWLLQTAGIPIGHITFRCLVTNPESSTIWLPVMDICNRSHQWWHNERELHRNWTTTTTNR